MSFTRSERNAPAVNRRRKLLLPGGVSLLEMVLAVSMLGAMTGTMLEWQAFEAARGQAVGAARQLVSLAHLVQDYAALQPRHYELADHRHRDMGISSSGRAAFGATYAPPAGGLMAGRWPSRFADLQALLPATFSTHIHLPRDPNPRIRIRIRARLSKCCRFWAVKTSLWPRVSWAPPGSEWAVLPFTAEPPSN